LSTIDKYIVKITDLCIGYGKGKSEIRLLDGISIEIHKGILTAIMGRNGTGKSTLLRTLCGLQKPLSGTIMIQDTPINSFSLPARARKISFVSTEQVKVSHMRIADLIALGRIPHTGWFGRMSAEDRIIVSDALAATGLSEKQDAFIDEISDGERQRAMIARALSQDTDLIFLDEPTAFLDVVSRYDIFHLLHKLTREREKTIIFSTHDLQLALSEADRILLMDKMNMIQGAPEDLLLSDKLSILFDREYLEFNRDNASLSLKKDLNHEIGLHGDKGSALSFTVKALERIGFRVSEQSDILPVITVKDTSDGRSWILQKKSETIEFYSIYDLSLHLRNFSN
jgi:iron complex transport system ATP-binding protein